MISEHQVRVGVMTTEDGRIKIGKFDGSDFRFWKMQIKDYVYGEDLY